MAIHSLRLIGAQDIWTSRSVTSIFISHSTYDCYPYGLQDDTIRVQPKSLAVGLGLAVADEETDSVFLK